MTRFPGGASYSGTAAKLDRMYVNAPLEAFALWDISNGVYGMLPEISDNLRIFSGTKLEGLCNRSSDIPDFIADSSLFQPIVDSKLQEHFFPEGCWAKLLAVKKMFADAAVECKKVFKHRGARTAGERIYWAISALRAVNDLRMD
eukprot:11129114-Karenia_brevis.AAC.1